MSSPGIGIQVEESEVDLDQFLNVQAEGSTPNPGRRLELPEADRLVVVGIFADDSGSMDHLTNAVIGGLKLGVEAFRGAKGSDFYLEVMGFRGAIFRGMLKDVKDDSFASYDASYSETPLVTHATSFVKKLRARADEYRAMGIPTTLALLIITDGFPNGEELEPRDFAKQIESANYVVGMGLAPSGNDSAVSAYKQLFKEMGVTKTVTPSSDPGEVRHAINQFSQSVASIAG